MAALRFAHPIPESHRRNRVELNQGFHLHPPETLANEHPVLLADVRIFSLTATA
ncbi:MAG: hypothetical protein ACREUY_06295 [Burkholderiales bacterium]